MNCPSLPGSPSSVSAVEVLETVGLHGREGQVVASLSGGQRARVSLATALLNRPELLVSSHVMDEAAECDALLLMREGSLVDQTTPSELRERTGERDPGAGFPECHPGGGDGLNARITIATARRVLWQIRRDPRTIALLIVVPCLLLVLLRYVFDAREETFKNIGAPLCGLFPFIIMFLITSITMLRERTTGTLERLMTLPLAKLDLLVGYGIAFGVLATAQAVAVCAVGFLALGLESPHGALLIGALAVANALLAMALGLFVSAFARSAP